MFIKARQWEMVPSRVVYFSVTIGDGTEIVRHSSKRRLRSSITGLVMVLRKRGIWKPVTSFLSMPGIIYARQNMLKRQYFRKSPA